MERCFVNFNIQYAKLFAVGSLMTSVSYRNEFITLYNITQVTSVHNTRFLLYKRCHLKTEVIATQSHPHSLVDSLVKLVEEGVGIFLAQG